MTLGLKTGGSGRGAGPYRQSKSRSSGRRAAASAQRPDCTGTPEGWAPRPRKRRPNRADQPLTSAAALPDPCLSLADSRTEGVGAPRRIWADLARSSGLSLT